MFQGRRVGIVSDLGTIERIAWEFALAVQIIEEKMSSPEAFQQWMRELGWDVSLPNINQIQNLVLSFTEVIDAIMDIDTDSPAIEQLDRYSDLLDKVLSFLSSIQNIGYILYT